MAPPTRAELGLPPDKAAWIKADWKKFNKAADEWYETWEPGYDCTVSLTPGNPNYGKPERFFHPSRVPKWRLSPLRVGVRSRARSTLRSSRRPACSTRRRSSSRSGASSGDPDPDPPAPARPALLTYGVLSTAARRVTA